MNSIVLKDIVYQYPLTDAYALDHVNFTFEKGKFYGIIGPNGCGKSTLCSLIKGLIPDFYLGTLTGEVEIEGKPVEEWDKSELCSKVGYIFQNPFTQISGIRESVLEEIVIGLENLGIPKDQMIERARQVTQLLDIYDLLDKNPNELSGGQRQRVAFASIVAMDTDIYVIDEPTSQLDPESTENVFRIIRSLKEQKKTILLVEHKIDLMAEYADELLVMIDGKIVTSGSPKEVFSDESLLERGVWFPQATIFAHDMLRAGKPLRELPITIEGAAQLVRERMEAGL